VSRWRLSAITVTSWLLLQSGCHLIFPFDQQLGELDGTGSLDIWVLDDRAEIPRDSQSLHDNTLWDKGVAPPEDKGVAPLEDKGVTPPEDKGVAPPEDKGTVIVDTGPCGCTDPQCCSNCLPVPVGTKCTHTNGYPHHCDGKGNCIECIAQGSQCGPSDPTPCCGTFTCDTWGPSRFETCGP
jgi:hypothetical protein